MLRLSWTQPEDVLPHALVAARLDGVNVDDIERRWIDAGGEPSPPATGASAEPVTNELRALARQLLTAVDEAAVPAGLLAAEPDGLDAIEQLAPGRADTPAEPDRDRLLGAWLGRAAGCLLGKPVEKIPRVGIRAIAQSTGNWPITGYFTARGLDPDVATAYPWNRRSAVNSLVENIDGMPEDDDLNFPLVALMLAERHRDAITTEDVAALWLDELPAGRVFTAERVAYRNLLEGEEPAIAGRVANPFQDWIGAQIRTDVYGWVCPGDPMRAARLAWHDGRLTHHRNGLYGAMFVAAACSLAVTGASVGECIDAGISVVPHGSRYAAAIRRGAGLGESRSPLDDALDELYDGFGHLHWVHVLNNAALVAFALMRSGGDFAKGITTVVAGGWDTDSNGATVGSICGAITGAANLPADWIAPLRNRLHSSIRGFDAISFDELADRTAAARLPDTR
jgi:ADP-ribosylglycohydrolase